LAVIYDAQGRGIDTNNPLPIKHSASDIIQPVEVQSKYAQTVQTHNAVSVALSSWSTESAWHDCDGFDKIAVSVLNDGNFACKCNVMWSNDGITKHGEETVASIATAISTVCQGIVDIKARYFKLSLNNQESALAHTMSAWSYLKA
jgi:hypothetical protein